ncbi:MAG: class I SAM-dependent methyltransferase, partial [Dehalococcoidia bacterium]|nr:class I SAM-dependent methyltransferase [Dehalococcoidia bacterium]
LTDVEVHTGRAEDLALDPGLRESFDVVVSRGIASMRILMELTLPYCRVGGMVVTLKKGEIASEVVSSLHAMEVLGGRIRESRGVDIEGLRDGRVLVVVDKVKNTPSKFPRRPGLPRKHPL